MTDRFTQEQVVATVSRLTHGQLLRFIEIDIVKPERSQGTYTFRRIDIARLELLCDLSEDLDLDETALTVVVSLIDQLHAARQDLHTLARAIDRLPEDLRRRVLDALAAGAS